jgi:hypothetical protein
MNKPKPKMSPELERFLAESAIKERLYHGTTDDINKFDLSHSGKKTGNLTTALGIFLSDNPTEANRYAEQWGTKGGNIMPLHVQAKNPYHMPYKEFNNLAMGAWNRRMADPDYDPNKVTPNFDREAHRKAAENLLKHEKAARQDVTNRRNELMAQGHDSVIVNIGGNREIIAFHPNQIKSAIGNRGTYDVNENDINKAQGGLVHMDKGGRPPQQINLDMAREAAERIGQHHDPFTRSLQQGYEHGWYHGSTGDIEAFDPNTRGESTGAASAKKGYFFARDPSTPPPEMIEHNPESLAMLQKIGATIPPKPTMAGHGAHTASSYAGTGGSREYKEAMRMAKAAEKIGNWNAYEKYMQLAEDAEINNMRYRQDLVAKHGDARDLMYDQIKNAWYGAHNAEMFKKMSQPDYEAHDKRYKELMPYGWHIHYEKPHYEMLKAELQKFGDNKQVKSALNAINHYQSVHNERKAAEVESGANVMPVALRYKNPMYHDFKGSSYRDETYSDLMDQAMRGGHDALILKNTYDPGGIGKPKMVDVGVVFHPNQIRSKFAAFDPTRKDESHLLAAKGGVVSMLRKHGRPVASDLDAMRKMSNGHRVFIAHEQDEIPTEIHRVSDMHGYTPDQIYTVAPEHFIQHKAEGGSMSGVNLYSPLNKSAESIPRTKGTGAEFMTELSKKPGFKKAEVEDRGLEALNALPKMTKEQFHAHLHFHPNPQITTKILRDESEKHYTVPHYPDENSYNDLHNVVDEEGRQVNEHPFRNRGEAQSHIEGLEERDNKTYHKYYKLPGGSNYQEHLYKYDPKDKSQFVANAAHYGGAPNILASARTVDRNTPEGKKILHVEEIQSDWHQKGRDNGYKQNLTELPKNYKLEERNINNRREYLITDENGKLFSMGLSPESATNNALNNLNDGKRAPNAPFKKNWEEMVAKQLLKHAVENGYHGVALTSGDEQADRYSLAKQVGQINYMPTTKQLIAYDHSGNPIIHENGVAPEDLDKYVGKEVADKLNKSEWEGSSRVLRGEDIKVGGEGMKSAYDKRIPNIFNDLGKKHGAKMQLHAMPVQKEAKYYAQMHDNGFGVFKEDEEDEDAQLVSNHLNLEKANAKAKELNSTKLHYMPLTPELVNHVKKEGLPIYKKGGYVSNDLDTMKYELHMASGGSTLGATMRPSLAQMKFEMSKKYNPLDIQGVGANEAPDLSPKTYINPSETMYGKYVSPGGVSQSNGMPIGGEDQNPQQPGQQLTPQQPGQPPQPPQPGQPQGQQGQGTPPQAPQPTPPMGNMLSLTPEGQAMNAMGGGTPPPQNMAKGGEVEGEMEAPSKTVKAYKLFRVHEKHPGKLFPLFIGKHEPVEMGKWVSAEHIPTKGFAERPGWHAGELPMATHIGERGDPNVTAPTIRPHNQVWTEIEMPHDVDWQSEANRRGTNKQGKVIAREAHITNQVPHGGHYRYKTNPNMTGSWLIGGAMKVNKILSDAEVKKINKAAKSSDLPRKEPFDKKKFGFADGGMARGGSLGYLKTTPLKPNPEVGTRMTVTPQGNLAKRKNFDIFAHEGKGSILTTPYDATTRDNLVTEVSGHNLTNPLLTEAGNDYSLDKKNLKDKIGGASNLDIASRVQDRVEQAFKEHGGNVFMMPSTMGEDAEYFSHHPAHIILDLMKQRNLNRNTQDALSDDIRNQFEYVKNKNTGDIKKVFPYVNFLGFHHPNVMEQILKGGHGLGTSSGNLRKTITKRLGMVNMQKLLDYNMGDVKAAILDPSLATDPKAYVGHTVVQGAPNSPLRQSKHTVYDTDITGVNRGTLGNNRPIEIVAPDVFQNLEKQFLSNPKTKNATKAQMRNMVVGAMEKRKEGIAQPINSRVINNAGLYAQGLKQGEFDPKDLNSVLAYYARNGGYKTGGKVKIHKDMDTMRLELTQRKKVK